MTGMRANSEVANKASLLNKNGDEFSLKEL